MKTRLIITAVLAAALAGPLHAQRSVEWSADSFDMSLPIEFQGSPSMISTRLGTALEFDGTDDGIFVGSVPVKGMEEFTIQMIFNQYGDAPFEQRFMHMGEYSGARIMFETRVKPNNTWYFDAFVHMGTKEESKALIDENLTHPTDRWYNLALTVSKDGITSYVDGVKQCSYPLSYNRTAIGEGSTSLGVRQNLVCWFKGAIFKVLVTPSVLTPDQFLRDQEELNKDVKPRLMTYQDPNAPFADRVEDLLKRLSLEQKVKLMMNTSQAIPEFGIREYDWWNEALHGSARAGVATVFPQAIGMASSFDDDLLEKVFTVASDEQRIKFIQARRAGRVNRYHGLTVWTPNINIFRDPRWGRGQETYGEDPYLTSRMGYAVVTGLQGPKVGKYDKLHACLKHFAVHSGPEGTRHSFDVTDYSFRDLNETYLYAFEKIIRTTDVQEVMCAYNRVDSKPCCGNDQLLMHFLREKWGYKGLVVSDCGAIDDFFVKGRHETFLNDATSAVANAVRTGTDIECGSSYRHLVEAVNEGKITEDDIDVSVRRLLLARFRLGEMDRDEIVNWNSIPESRLACAESRELSLKMARESMVLLQNKGILPLSKDIKCAVVGPNAADSVVLNGNYFGVPVSSVTAYKGIADKIGAKNVSSDASDADVVIYVGGLHPNWEGEEMRNSPEGFDRGDRTTIELPSAQRKEIAALKAAGKKVIFVNMSGSAVALKPETANCEAILQAWYPGEAGGAAVADVLFGDYNPGGRLPVTFYAGDSDLPDFNDYGMEGRTYRYFKGKPLFAFGHGLSYTTFKYGTASFRNGMLVVPVTNTGRRDGDEVVQVYVKRLDDAEGPSMSLRGFKRVNIPAGKTVTVSIPLDDDAFSAYDSKAGEMRTAPGRFRIFYGPSSNVATLKNFTINR